MKSYIEQVKEFENNYSAVIDRAVRDLSEKFDFLYSNKKMTDIPAAIMSAEKLLQGQYNIPTQMQIYYDIANGYHDLRKLGDAHIECDFEKELYNLRYALDLYENNYFDNDGSSAEVKVARYIAMRCYTNLGNAYHSLGRFIVAIDCYQDALLISNDFAMASLNLSLSLFEYAQLQIKKHEQNYYHHACYYYYKQTENCKINLENETYLQGLERIISRFDPKYVENFLCKPLELPLFLVDNQEEADYRNYLRLFRLFLEPCLDILSDPCFAVDSVTLPFKAPFNDREKEFIGLFNQIKQEYNWARLLWYKISTEEVSHHYSDQEMDLIDTGDSSNFSFGDSALRAAFKAAYSLFDRIGFFINHYFEIGLTGAKVSFKNVWKGEIADKNGKVFFTVPNPIMTNHSDNPLIQAMYWLQKDFYERKEISITAPHAERIFQMRNDMEHNCMRTGKKMYNTSFTKYTTEGTIENNTFRLLKLARELIIYLSLAVGIDQINKVEATEEKGK